MRIVLMAIELISHDNIIVEVKEEIFKILLIQQLMTVKQINLDKWLKAKILILEKMLLLGFNSHKVLLKIRVVNKFQRIITINLFIWRTKSSYKHKRSNNKSLFHNHKLKHNHLNKDFSNI